MGEKEYNGGLIVYAMLIGNIYVLMEPDEEETNNDDEVDDRYSRSCDFPPMELSVGELNAGTTF